MKKYQAWWESLTPETQQYLKSQPHWHDKDLYHALAVGIVVGFILRALL